MTIHLGQFKAGETVPYALAFHGRDGNAADPAAPTLWHRTPAGVWSALTAPAIQNSLTGVFGGTIDTTDFATGLHVFVQSGVVPDAITRRETYALRIIANTEADVLAAIPAPSTNAGAVRTELGAELARIDAAITTRLAAAGYTAPPSASANASAVRNELADELARLDEDVSAAKSLTSAYDAAKTAASQASVDSILAAIAGGAFAVSIVSPVTETGDIAIMRGDSYPDGLSRSIILTINDAQHVLGLDEADHVTLTSSGIVLEASGVSEVTAGWLCRWEPTSDDTQTLVPGDYKYAISATWHQVDPVPDTVITPVIGTLEVVEVPR